MDITLSVTIPEAQVDRILRDIMENFPEASHGNALRCEGWEYNSLKFTFYDEEQDRTHAVDKAALLKAFPLMFGDAWPKGLRRPPLSEKAQAWDDWFEQTDATDFDAFVQLAIFGEVIYG